MESMDKIKEAIRKAVDEHKEKTWFNFHGVPFQDMYNFLDDYVTITRDEYKHLIHCREELLRIYEERVCALRNEMVQESIDSIVNQNL